MTKKGKRILSYILAFWLMGNLSYSNKPKPHYEIVNNGIHFANYSRGRIFIGKQDDLDSLEDLGEDDILILDARDEEDPDMKVMDSYKIIEPVCQEEVILVMLDYEKLDPSNWSRTEKSMLGELHDHLTAYYIGYEIDSAKDVDFNNSDEGNRGFQLVKRYKNEN